MKTSLIPPPSFKPEPFTPEMWAYLLTLALRSLTEEQRAGLCFDIYSRSDMPDAIDARIEALKTERATQFARP
jgi:hypothetical protein